MYLKNVRIYTSDKQFVRGSILIRNGFIHKILPEEEMEYSERSAYEPLYLEREEILDGGNLYAIPGLIDMHLHGCKGADFCDGSFEALETIAKYQLAAGVTAFAPATMTLPIKELEAICKNAVAFQKKVREGADLVGIHMEGPFISPTKCGAQNSAHVLPCDVRLAERFCEVSEGLVKVIGIAPETNSESFYFIRKMKDKVKIALAHTDADYETSKRAFEAGANHVVHLFNAMPYLKHREPGVIGAAADYNSVTVEMICDGVHVHPAMVRAAFKLFGANRIIFISDSMRATGMPEGIYTLGGQEVVVKDGTATLVVNNVLAGSVCNLMDCLRIVVKQMGIALETVLPCVTLNPAKVLGIEKEYGSLEIGKRGNIVLLDEELRLQGVLKDGKIIRLS